MVLKVEEDNLPDFLIQGEKLNFEDFGSLYVFLPFTISPRATAIHVNLGPIGEAHITVQPTGPNLLCQNDRRAAPWAPLHRLCDPLPPPPFRSAPRLLGSRRLAGTRRRGPPGARPEKSGQMGNPT